MLSLRPMRSSWIPHSKGPVYPTWSPGRQMLIRRHIRISPQYLLDDYNPRYVMLTPKQIECKIAEAETYLHNCTLCPHNCGVDRYVSTGYCALGAQRVPVSNISPHFGEESCITGMNGSGSIFFASCNLRCVFCQNYEISHVRDAGEMLTAEEIGEWMVKLQDMGQCHNINLVTPEHVVPIVVKAIAKAKDLGLRIPIVYNTSSFDSIESLKLMDGLIDIYLADFKLWSPDSAKRFLKSERYPDAARHALIEMARQVGVLKFTGDGLAKQGVLIRHLIMPNCLDESRQIMKYIADEVDRDSYVNIMSQYFPSGHVGRKSTRGSGLRYEELNRHVTDAEIEDVMTAARKVGLWRFDRAEPHAGYA
ncbi:putative radical SAM superfamily protein [Lipomyces tetrasporus]|uniref:Radical SAM superfamily protein n=1 Tax=Lipomyces tetrasporus TaxID=54092 RepID=A0AAD7QWM9_9ASCO|nr:putative radical SAM superfamily protein [Lipomyces tetrasporus]KAJ8102874.1 putative radical SAM superfamily protein [Lipomyces tetrasporus]